jgi:hypothetical protein
MNLSVSRVGFAMPMQSQNVQFKGMEKTIQKAVTNTIKKTVKNPEYHLQFPSVSGMMKYNANFRPFVVPVTARAFPKKIFTPWEGSSQWPKSRSSS